MDGALDALDEVPAEEAGQGEIGVKCAGGAEHRVLDRAIVDRPAVRGVFPGPAAHQHGELFGRQAARIHLVAKPRRDA